MKKFRRFCFKSSVCHTKVKISALQFTAIQRVQVTAIRTLEPKCITTVHRQHWNCEWEDIVLEHDRDDYISCMWWFMRDNTDTFVPHFNKRRNAADMPFFVSLRLTLSLQASHRPGTKFIKKMRSTPQVICLFQTQLVFRSRTSTWSHHKQLSTSVSTGFFSFWNQSNISCKIQICWTSLSLYIYILYIIQQGCIKLIERDRKAICNVTKALCFK